MRGGAGHIYAHSRIRSELGATCRLPFSQALSADFESAERLCRRRGHRRSLPVALLHSAPSHAECHAAHAAHAAALLDPRNCSSLDAAALVPPRPSDGRRTRETTRQRAAHKAASASVYRRPHRQALARARRLRRRLLRPRPRIALERQLAFQPVLIRAVRGGVRVVAAGRADACPIAQAHALARRRHARPQREAESKEGQHLSTLDRAARYKKLCARRTLSDELEASLPC